MDPIVWAVVLMALGMVLVVMEVFFPSGGILGFLAVTSFLSAIGIAFSYHGVRWGMAFSVSVLVLSTASLLGAFRWWPSTPMGRRVLLSVPTEEEVLPEQDPRAEHQKLLGRVGVATSDMLPGGTIEIDRNTYEAVSEGKSIDRGQSVEIVDTQNNRLVVRHSDQEPAPVDEDEILSRPIDTVGLDPFEDPLA